MKESLIITGVGKGFGAELFKHFLPKYHVIGLTRSQSDVDRLMTEHTNYNNKFDLFAVDVAQQDKVYSCLHPFLENETFHIYGLINNAGIRCRKSFTDISIDEIKNVAEVNLFSPIYITKLVLPSMLARSRGRIINVSSILSTSALPELLAYTVSKAGLDGFTRSITAEYADRGITCNSILPGFCETSYFQNFKSKTELYQMTLNRTPAKRWGSDSELIGLCDLLLDSNGGYINGASIPVDGGWSAC